MPVRAVIYFGFPTEYPRSNTAYHHKPLPIVREQSSCALASLMLGSAMVQVYVPRVELLDALKGCLHDLEELKLISPSDLDIIDERRILRHKIAELEKEG